jgi:hypothetical protein
VVQDINFQLDIDELPATIKFSNMCKYKIDLYIIPSLNLYHIESEYITCAKMEVKRNPTMFVLSIYDGTLFNAARNYSFWAVKEHYTASISEMKRETCCCS